MVLLPGIRTRPRTDIDPEQARRIAEALPAPVFDADRRLLELDRLEGGLPGNDPARPPRIGRRPDSSL